MVVVVGGGGVGGLQLAIKHMLKHKQWKTWQLSPMAGIFVGFVPERRRNFDLSKRAGCVQMHKAGL